MVAFILWTFTLIAGAIWAKQAWGAYWQWDPKEVWTFVIWTVYAAYMHAARRPGSTCASRCTSPSPASSASSSTSRSSTCLVRRHAQLLGDVTVVRYTVLRLLIFFGVLLVLWLVGLRNNPVLLLGAAAASVLLSFFLLRSQRDRFSEQIQDRMEKRQEAKRRAQGGVDPDSDEAAEDAERWTNAPTADAALSRFQPGAVPSSGLRDSPKLTTKSGRMPTGRGSGRRIAPATRTPVEFE